MRGKLKETKTAIFLLAATAVFLCAVLLTTLSGRKPAGSYQVSTEYETAASAAAQSQETSDTAGAAQGGTEEAPRGEKLSLNSASAQELETLPGIGPTLAGRIVDWRQANGPYKTEEDLLNVKGIGEKTLEKIRDLVTVEENA